MNTFLSCQQKYIFKYVDRREPEVGGEGVQAIDRGRAFHTLVETNGAASVETDLQSDPYEHAVVYSAFNTYESLRQAGAIPSIKLKEAWISSEEHQFIGKIDGMAELSDGSWMLAEMKTSKRFDPVGWATLQINTQIALYSAFALEFATKNWLEYDRLIGTSYQKVIFSAKKPLAPTKKKRPYKETPEAYAERIKDDAKVHHQLVVSTPAARADALHTFERVKETIHSFTTQSTGLATKNTGNCFQWGRVCEFFGACHGKSFEDLEEDSGTTIIENDLGDMLDEEP